MKTHKLIKSIEDATGCTVMLERIHALELHACLDSDNGNRLVASAVHGTKRKAVKSLAREVRQRGKRWARAGK